ncbi:MAG: restriction endonuclease [Vicinamibacterales bacterium]|nr:restriction endonuclease [Vicinamibacterales bacterium]
MHSLTPSQFEAFVCDRLFAMGFEPRQVGKTNRKDGGVDIVFWPRANLSFPFLGAVQLKHHRNVLEHEGPKVVREFAGAIAGHPFNAGVVVTNTSFSPDAEWFAQQHARLVRLRGFSDLCRWIAGAFGDDAEWREVPKSIELCPGIVIKIR